MHFNGGKSNEIKQSQERRLAYVLSSTHMILIFILKSK